jgi:hypothetical protein
MSAVPLEARTEGRVRESAPARLAGWDAGISEPRVATIAQASMRCSRTLVGGSSTSS